MFVFGGSTRLNQNNSEVVVGNNIKVNDSEQDAM